MTPEQVIKKLDAGEISPVYYLSGEDLYRKNLIVKKLKELIKPDDFNFFDSSADKTTPAELLSIVQTQPMLSEKRLVIVRRTEKLSAEFREELIKYLKNPLPSTCLVLTCDDRKSAKEISLSKACAAAGETVIFYQPDEAYAARWVAENFSREKIKILPPAAALMVEICGA
ncbi:MAG: hypothetical protein NTW04_04015, partial [Elusimicrobia bacterium]|nr:hypothetical protein [Elusimicrobiota bacterium]